MLRLGWQLLSLGQDAARAQLQPLHIVVKTEDYSSASSWNAAANTSENITTATPAHFVFEHFRLIATVSDHWSSTARNVSKRMKNNGKMSSKKPIRSKRHDRDRFNSAVRANLNEESGAGWLCKHSTSNTAKSYVK